MKKRNILNDTISLVKFSGASASHPINRPRDATRKLYLAWMGRIFRQVLCSFSFSLRSIDLFLNAPFCSIKRNKALA